MNKIVHELLKPLSGTPLQAYLDNRVQLFDIIEKVLLETGTADIYITTFSTSEEFLRKIFRFRKKGLIRRATMVTDLKASKKTSNLYQFIYSVFDDVYLGENHSKVILIVNNKWNISICTSQNQTRGNRAESGIISTDKIIFDTLYQSLSTFINSKTIQLNGLFPGADK